MDVQNSLAEMYKARRQRLASQIDTGIVLINSAGVAPDPSLFDKNLRYLTGLHSKKAALVLAPRGMTVDRWETRTGPRDRAIPRDPRGGDRNSY